MLISITLILIALMIRVAIDLYFAIELDFLARIYHTQDWFYIKLGSIILEEILPLLALIVMAYF